MAPHMHTLSRTRSGTIRGARRRRIALSMLSPRGLRAARSCAVSAVPWLTLVRPELTVDFGPCVDEDAIELGGAVVSGGDGIGTRLFAPIRIRLR